MLQGNGQQLHGKQAWVPPGKSASLQANSLSKRISSTTELMN